MPELSRFYGIVIQMYYKGSDHNPPHVHARYGESVAEVDINSGEVMKKNIFHTIRSVGVLDNNRLVAQFDSGIVKIYSIVPISEKILIFKNLIDNHLLFSKVKVDVGGYGIIWNEEIDLSSEEIWINGETIHTDFDNLLSFGDASHIWGVEESTLRKAVSYGKLVPGIDCCKYGKQWVVNKKAMIREYGPKDMFFTSEDSFLIAAEKNQSYGKE